jgi:hypothetical protein
MLQSDSGPSSLFFSSFLISFKVIGTEPCYEPRFRLVLTWYLTVTKHQTVHRGFALSLTTRSSVYTSCITRKLLQRGNDNAIYANESLVR